MTDKCPSDEASGESENRDELDASEALSSAEGLWRTPVIRSDNGEAIGASFFVSEEDLLDMGIVLEDDAFLLYSVTDDGIRVTRKP